MKKEFSGNMSIVINLNFDNIKANSIEEATEILFSSALDINLINTKQGNGKISIDVQEWDIIKEMQQGNIAENHIKDFTISEEKE